jgi:Sulfatase
MTRRNGAVAADIEGRSYVPQDNGRRRGGPDPPLRHGVRWSSPPEIRLDPPATTLRRLRLAPGRRKLGRRHTTSGECRMRKGSLGLQDHLLLSVTFVAVFALIPFELYFTGREYWSFPQRSLFAIAGWGLAGYLAGCVLLHLVAAYWRAGVAVGLARGLFCLGLFVLLADLYAPLQATPLDGSELRVTESGRSIAIEAALFLLAGALFVAMMRKRAARTIATVFSVLLLLTAAGYAVVIVLVGEETDDEVVAEATRRPITDLGGNVYHIVLDAMQTDAFLLASEKNRLAQNFSGFTVYRNNMANYLATDLSLPSYFTGTFYHKGDLEEWKTSWPNRSLFKRLSDENFRTWMYGPKKYWNNRHVDHFVLDLDVYEQEAGLLNGDLADFLQIWVARLAPNILASEALALSRDVRRRVREPSGPTGSEIPITTEDGTKPYAGVLMIRRAIRDEGTRSPRGEYVYVHTLLPHPPFVLDEGCRYDGEQDKTSTAAYLAQAECAAKLLVEFFDYLKRLGRYEAATIIVHGDHGAARGFFSEPEPGRPSAQQPTGGDAVRFVADNDGNPEWLAKAGLNGARWNKFKERVAKKSRTLAARARALLMIKPPHAGGELTVSDEPSQLVDIFPTLLDLLGIDPPEHDLHGRSLVRAGETHGRDARFGIIREQYTKEMIEVRMNNQLDFWSSDLTLIGPAAEPRLWREELRRDPCRGADGAASRTALPSQGARIVEGGGVSETGMRPQWCEARRDRH